MRVSVIIPARDAADTIAETFGSLESQTFKDWEAIVIDDGSSDETAEITQRQAERDPRFRLVVGDAAGVGAARNKGLRHAQADWVLFLDADDWIVPTHMERLTGRLREDPDMDGAACGYARVSEDGAIFDQTRWWQPDELFQEFARTCPWTVHSCIVRKELIDEVGGFLPGWKTCEDWDLWQRVARTGARFAMIDEPLALYRMRQGSASLDAVDMVRGAIATINRGHGPDPRVPNPKPEYANGASPEGAARARLLAVNWAAGLHLGCGRDARELLEPVKHDHDPSLDPTAVASGLFLAMLVPTSRSAEAWTEILPAHAEHIDLFLAKLEVVTGAPFLAARARAHLEQLTMNASSPHSTGVLGRSQVVTVEMTEPIRDVIAEPGVERIACHALLEGQPVGSVHLPAWDGVLSRSVLADAIGHALWEPLVSRYLADAVYGKWARSHHRAAWLGRRLVREVANRMPGRKDDFEKWAVTSVDWVALLSELFDSRTAPGPKAPVDRIDVDITRPIPRVRAATEVLQVLVTCGGAPVGWVSIPARPGRRVSARRIRHAIVDACGLELARLAARDAILGRPIDGAAPLREVLARRPATERDGGDAVSDPYRDPEKPTLLLGRSPDNGIGTSASRRVELPADLPDELVDAFPVRRLLGDGPPSRIVRAPELIRSPSGASEADAGAATARDRLLPPVDAASRVRRTRDLVARFAERAIPALRHRAPDRAIADRLPILMFHRVADEGPTHLTPWRLSRSQFEDRLRSLRDRGYYSVTFEQWHAAKDRRRQLRGRPVLLTFDDGYQDFADEAWPLLRKYGFSAIVFLVADRIGRTNDWDIGQGDDAPLMDWSTIRRLRDEGVTFGSHTCTHPPLSALKATDVVREGIRSRLLLEEGLGHPVNSIAYPYGDYDAVVRHLMSGCGYRFAVTCRADVSRYTDELLELPRFNVDPAVGVEELTRRMELRHLDEGS